MGLVTFTIPFRAENPDRIRNLNTVLHFLTKNFDARIIVAEMGIGNSFSQWYDESFKNLDHIFVCDNTGNFHKTRLLNIAANACTTDIICSHDADTIAPIAQYINALQQIQNKECEMCFAYDIGVTNLKEDLHPFICSGSLQHYKIEGEEKRMRGHIGENKLGCPSGGVFLMRRDKFWEGGGENEYFKNYNVEDAERLDRFLNLGYKINRAKGMLFHLDHEKGHTSTWHNHLHQDGHKYYEAIKKLKGAHLREYMLYNFDYLNNYESYPKYAIPPFRKRNVSDSGSN